MQELRDFWAVGRLIWYLYVMVELNSTHVNELFGYTAVCYASISKALSVQGWELSAPPPGAVVPAGLSDTRQYLLLLTYWSRSYVQLESTWSWVCLYSLIELKGEVGPPSSRVDEGFCFSRVDFWISSTRLSDTRIYIWPQTRRVEIVTCNNPEFVDDVVLYLCINLWPRGCLPLPEQ